MRYSRRMKVLSFGIAAATLALSIGCSTSTTDDDTDSTSSALGALSPAQLAATKQAVRDIAYAHIESADDAAAVRGQLEPLLQKLAAHYGKKSASTKLSAVAGAWHQIWSDFPYPSVSFLTTDNAQIYQIVSPNGFYYNVGNTKALGIFGLTSVLRGSYEPAGPRVNVEFTKVGYRFGKLAKNEDLVAFANGLEDQSRYVVPLPGGGAAPKGPVGIDGTLETVYVDGDLRVDLGTQAPYRDANGNVLVPGVTPPRYFVLDRVSTPVE